MTDRKQSASKEQIYVTTAIGAVLASIGFASDNPPVPNRATTRVALMVVYGLIAVLALGAVLALLSGVMTGWEWIAVFLLAGVCSSFTMRVLRLRRKA